MENDGADVIYGTHRPPGGYTLTRNKNPRSEYQTETPTGSRLGEELRDVPSEMYPAMCNINSEHIMREALEEHHDRGSESNQLEVC